MYTQAQVYECRVLFVATDYGALMFVERLGIPIPTEVLYVNHQTSHVRFSGGWQLRIRSAKSVVVIKKKLNSTSVQVLFRVDSGDDDVYLPYHMFLPPADTPKPRILASCPVCLFPCPALVFLYLRRASYHGFTTLSFFCFAMP